METISSAPTTEQIVTDNSAMKPVSTSNVAPANQGQPQSMNGDKGGTEESFTSIDPKTLSPELQGIYKNMQRDFTAKNQTIAEQKRQYESASKKAELYDQVSSDPAFVEYWNGLNNKQKAEAINESNKGNLQITQEEFAKAFESPDNFLALLDRAAERKIEPLQKRAQALEAELTVSKANEFLESFKAKEEYKNFGKYEKLINLYIQSNPPEKPEPKYWEKSLKEAYAFVDQAHNDTFEEGRKAGLSRVEEKAAYSSESPSNGLSQVLPPGDPKDWSVKTAMDLARKKIRIK